MNKTIEDLLKSVCAEVSLLSDNNSQIVYSLKPKRDAHTAYAVCNTFGFEVKIYDESDLCRLYIARASLAGAEDRLNNACLYAETLGEIRNLLDNLRDSNPQQLSDFSINLMNVPGNGKKITISLEPEKVQESSVKPAVPASSARRGSQQQRGKRVGFSRHQEITVENIGIPKMAKTYLMQDGPNKGKEKGAHWRWLYRHFGRHILENSAPVIVLVFFLFVVSAVYATSKGFICPDIAVEQNKIPWYCNKEFVKSKLRGEIYIPKNN